MSISKMPVTSICPKDADDFDCRDASQRGVVRPYPLLAGDVNMNPSFPTRQITDPKEMFRFAMQLEQSTIDSYNDAARIAAEADDSVTHKMFQDLAVEEEEHLDYFRNELQNLLDYGDKEYLALQSFARSKAEAEGKVSE